MRTGRTLKEKTDWYWLRGLLVTGLFGWLGLVWLTGLFTKCEVVGVWLGDVAGYGLLSLYKMRSSQGIAGFIFPAPQC